ncbi:signal peptidase I [Xylanibacillus composti]|uniref:Signal peptidase I n=1 Tax=Xylanibacillus composti TaxID=1572762 RepID=A0A8J4H0I6_9BACL|nr:signal peptidase I [Xylanibacillus composti]MDT9724118.1 signal peptidase I [Xylanibacillus composti]GIQ68668.1 signal peptidase I [Xylanibacillus composti]
MEQTEQQSGQDNIGQADQQQASSSKNEWWEWIKALLIAFAIVFLVRHFLFTPTVVSGPSMEPNFYDKERLIVNKIIYDIREPRRGEVIVFHAPEHKDFIKRIIALPGETVQVDGDRIYINGQLLDEPYIEEEIAKAKANGMRYNRLADFSPTEVPEGTVFVLGDNRPNSKDSRFGDVGFIAYDQIVGRADLVFWPLTQMEILSHPDYEVEP